MKEQQDHTIFINYINDHYDEVKQTLKILSGQRNQSFNEDAFHESIIRCHNAIQKKGFLQDKSPYGITSYLIRAYFNYILETKRAACNAKRDQNYTSDNIGGLYEDYYNSNFTDARQKVINDLFRDYAVLYVMMVAEQNFDQEHFYLFKLKELCKDMTYKKLSEKTKIKGVRQKVVEVKRFIQANVTKDEIRKSFFETFGDIL